MGRWTRFANALIAAFLAVPAVAAPDAAARPACAHTIARVAGGTWDARPVDDLRGARFTWRITGDGRDPRLVVVADSEGILVTRDGGCTWERGVEYADALAPFAGNAIDAAVAGTGGERSLHVLVAPWAAFVPNGPAKLFSSFDDGATWTVADVPLGAGPAAVSALTLAASPAVPGRVYLLANQSAASSVYAGNGEDEWSWRSVGASSPDDPPCAAGEPCPSRSLRTLDADPRGRGLWGSTFTAMPGDEVLAQSSDDAVTWEYRPIPPLNGGVSAIDAAPGSILLAGDFWEYALSRDGGESWAVGSYPKVASSTSISTNVFEMAHFDRDRAAAIVPGDGPVSGWAGNVLVFDGRRWTNAAPPGFTGYARTDAEGNRLSFAGLVGTDGPLLALSSTGELMAFRR